MNTVDQTPRRPALAYNVVAELLPPAYFEKPAPERGWRFEITGEDGVTTHWLMPHKYAAALDYELRTYHDIRPVITRPR